MLQTDGDTEYTVVTFIFISNTRQKVADLDTQMNINNQIIKNNLIGLNNVSNVNDTLLDQKYSSLFEINMDDDSSALKIKKNTEINGSLSICDTDGINCKVVQTSEPEETLE